MTIRWKAKPHSGPEGENDLARAFKALGHPARLHLFRTILEQGPLPAGELAKSVPQAPSTVSQHLNQLKRSGLVQDSAQGLLRVYEIDRRAWSQFRRSLLPFLTSTPAGKTISTKYASRLGTKGYAVPSPEVERS